MLDLQSQLGIELSPEPHGRVGKGGSGPRGGTSWPRRPAKKSTKEMIRRAALSNLGILSRLEKQEEPETGDISEGFVCYTHVRYKGTTY